MRYPLAFLALLLVTAALAPAAAASNLIVRNATQVQLEVDGRSEALVSYRVNGSGPVHHTLIWGAINARAPQLGVPQTHFRFDYAGG